MAEKPGLAIIVSTGASAPEAMQINDFIWYSKDISNAYLINGVGAHLLVNTGTPMNAVRNVAAFAPLAAGSLEAIVVTQSHPDHFGGVNAFREPRTKVIVDQRFPQTLADYQRTAPYLDERTFKLWEPLLGPGMRNMRAADPFQTDILVERDYAFAVGGLKIVAISTPGGETPDSLVVHLPDHGIVFTGNFFGPAWLNIPNLYTIRGDRIRSAAEYIRCLDRVRALEPRLLITGHGDPIEGAETIDTNLARMRGAAQYLLDYTVDGMNAGKALRTLMREVSMPAEYQVGQLHGKYSWNVRAIWEEHVGWFDYGSTTDLYGVPRSSVAPDLVDLAGGVAPLVARAEAYTQADEPLKALHLLDIVLDAAPGDSAGLAAKAAALEAMLVQPSENLSETMWLRSEVLACKRALGDET